MSDGIEPVKLEDVRLTASVIGGKWKPAILYCLARESLRFAALRRALPPVSEKVLAQQLRELERDGLVERAVKPTVPPQVEYSMSVHGRSLCGVIEQLSAWGALHRGFTATRSEDYENRHSGWRRPALVRTRCQSCPSRASTAPAALSR